MRSFNHVSHQMVQAFSLLCLVALAHSYKSHFLIKGEPKDHELQKFIEENSLTYHFCDCMGPDLHYFVTDRTGNELLELYESCRFLPWVSYVEHQPQFPVEKKALSYYPHPRPYKVVELPDDDEYILAVKKRAEKMRFTVTFNDPNSRDMWQFLNDGNSNVGEYAGVDLNVYPVYMANITGKGVIGIIVDDALDTTHDDLLPNIQLNLTADLVNVTRKDARGTDARMDKVDNHGTEVAGLFAAVANNSICAFGVAYNATLGGVRLLGNRVTDFMVGEALTLFSDVANIYISSWGPTDDGRTLRSPGKYMNSALKESGTKGNHGRGSVFVFPAGNGGAMGDNCGADGFVNHPNVIAVSAVSENGLPPAYSEACSAIAIAVPVGGAQDRLTFKFQLNTQKLFVYTTKINNLCTGSFVGTSASNPIAAGVIALAMEANPNLTPRDVSALLALSGRIPSPSAVDFSINGGGLLVSHTYGSGLLNAVRMVKLARQWKPLGQRKLCFLYKGEWRDENKLFNETKPKSFTSKFWKTLFSGRSIKFTFNFKSSTCGVEVLEMVRVGMQWTSVHRGSIEVFLTSPSGQVANLLMVRFRDHYNGLSQMIWKSLIHTGESCHGKWIVTVRDTGQRAWPLRSSRGKLSGSVLFIGMEMVGTSRNESAFDRNKEEIVKNWHQIQIVAHNLNRAVQLDRRQIANLYNWKRWCMLKENMED
ncbi:Furin 1 [Echinococcus multilocularis]|uniref:Furin 1 n=1 Tax=Echinococcus multilocularis TaxID=6211 RepID=A0A087VXT5_ECHMU|nr:Furin 1 [Echinococcus multilocularis]